MTEPLANELRCSLCKGPLTIRQGYGRFTSTTTMVMSGGLPDPTEETATLALCADCDERLDNQAKGN